MVKKMNLSGLAVIAVLLIGSLIMAAGCSSPTGSDNSGNQSYTVTVVSTGTGPMGSGTYKKGDIVTISAGLPASGQQFKNWTSVSTGVTFANSAASTTSFAMPGNDVTVTAVFESALTSYVVTVSYNSAMGSVTAKINGVLVTGTITAQAGQSVTLTATADASHYFDKYTVDGTDQGANPYTFTMPAHDVSVTASFVNIPEGSGAIKITVNADANFAGFPAQTFTLSQGGAQPMEITLTGGYTSANWYVDGELVTDSAWFTGNTFILDAAKLDRGSHSLTVTVNIGGLQYSSPMVDFTVTR